MKALACSIPIDEAGAGMVLAEAVRDVSGAVLLAAGATLSEATLNALRRRGIASLCIIATNADDEDNKTIGSAGEAERARRCERLTHLFRHSPVLGANGALLEHLMSYRKTH